MPRTKPESNPTQQKLYDIAASQMGYFTLAQAQEADFSAPLLAYHIQQGRIERAGRGVFRLKMFPPGEHEDLVVLWLWSKQIGVFSHETALFLYDLSDTLPSKHHMTVPLSWKNRRLTLPPLLILHYQTLTEEALGWVGAIPVTTPLQTIVDCQRDHSPQELVTQATEQGLRRGLFSEGELRQALSSLQVQPTKKAI